MAAKNPLLSSSCMDLSSCWDPIELEHCSPHAPCPAMEPCCDADNCDADNCSVNCSSVCDGFVDCDASSHCSEENCASERCASEHCEEMHCEDVHCQSNTQVCFDKSCVLDAQGDAMSPSHNVLGQDGTFNWNSDLLQPDHSTDFDLFYSHHNTGTEAGPGIHHSLGDFAPDSASTHKHFDTHHSCHHSSLDRPPTDLLQTTPYHLHNHVHTPIIDEIFNLCPNFSDCSHQPDMGCGLSQFTNLDDILGLMAPIPHGPCEHHLHHPVKLSIESPSNNIPKPSLQLPHSASHPASSVNSSPLTSSPLATPPLRDTGMYSPMTSPDHVPNSELHVCRWISSGNGTNAICGASFADSGKLQDHLIAEHVGTIQGSQGYGYYCRWEGCSRPNEPFSQKSKLQGHFLTHSNHKGFQCSVCGKQFARQATLERHERSHRGEKPYKCKECGKSFTDSSELKTHSRTHTGEKPFKCNYPGCSFETGDSSNMSSHKLTHGVRKHKCIYAGCPKSFTRPDQLKRHLRTAHKHEGSPSIKSPSPLNNAIPV